MRKIVIFISLFTLLNLSLVPLMSMYGLSICPILRIPGFYFGCAYAGSFIASVLIINYSFTFLLFRRSPVVFQKHPYLAYAGIYLISSMIGLVVLQQMFNINHISGDSRAPEILGLVSLILGITQTYGLDWAMGKAPTKTFAYKLSFNRSWLEHTLRSMAPILTVMVLLTHFILIQSYLQGKKDSIAATPEELVEQTGYIISFALVWLSVTYLFHFLSERESAVRVNEHLHKIELGNYEYTTEESGSWGLWRSLISHLNDFSKIFGERTKLLKSFSRFVTGEVAQHAMKSEIIATAGKEEELTVIMTDIRDFTRMSQEMSAEEVVRVLNTYFTVMLDEMVKHEIVVDKFIGDGILAYVENSDPTASKWQNQKAVDSALGMLQRLRELNAKSQSPELKIGIGIYRGPLIKGYIGSFNKLQHTIIGDTVNRAARLESLCKELNVPLVITFEIWSQLTPGLKSKFKLFEKVKMKGIADATNVYGLST